MKIALAQINTTVADIRGNVEKICLFSKRARALSAEIALFPELTVTGYPPWDLLEQSDFIQANLKALQELTRFTQEPEIRGMALLVGFVDRNLDRMGKPLYNAAALIYGGKIIAKRYKSLLPTYDVFDEARYFKPARDNPPIPFQGHKLGVTICEDAWSQEASFPRQRYIHNPISEQTKAGAQFLLNLSASPFHTGKTQDRHKILSQHAKKARTPLLYCNLVGGNDELVFDGNSMAYDSKGRLLAHAKSFEEDIILIDVQLVARGRSAGLQPCFQGSPKGLRYAELDEIEQIYKALVLGIRDYAYKCAFKNALVGLSGGIDSSVVCALAVSALGKERVLGVSMPSPYSSAGSILDARALAKNLGIRLISLPIHQTFKSFLNLLKKPFKDYPQDITEQNLQARIRGTLLMALSNKFKALLISTGNKSEISTGYCTLYGDMNGGLAAIADVPKMAVYALAKYINREMEIIPKNSILKPPSAELKPNQKDQDDLPPYQTLDAILKLYIEEGKEASEIAAFDGMDEKLVKDAISRIDRAEYKRRQAPPGLKISPKAFGIGRKMPIARGYTSD